MNMFVPNKHEQILISFDIFFMHSSILKYALMFEINSDII